MKPFYMVRHRAPWWSPTSTDHYRRFDRFRDAQNYVVKWANRGHTVRLFLCHRTEWEEVTL